VRPSRATSGIGQVGSVGDDVLGQRASLAHAGGAGVDRPHLLVAGPGQLDLTVRVTDGQAGLQSGVLAFAQVLHAVPQQPADLVERVVAVVAPAELLLLHPAAEFVDDLAGELDDVEGIEHLNRVRQRVAQGVGVAAERIQRRRACWCPWQPGGSDRATALGPRRDDMNLVGT
jgi:hypothetical protein